MAKWVSYREVKGQVTFTMVFEHYELLDDAEIVKSGEMAIRCPFHDGASRTLKANDAKRGFQCFASECDKKGNVIDFVSFMEDKPFRNAALLLQEWFMKPVSQPTTETPPQDPEASTPPPCNTAETEPVSEPPAVPSAPPTKGRGYMREVDATLRELIAADDPDALVKWVKEELLASYRRGVDKQKAASGTDTR